MHPVERFFQTCCCCCKPQENAPEPSALPPEEKELDVPLSPPFEILENYCTPDTSRFTQDNDIDPSWEKV